MFRNILALVFLACAMPLLSSEVMAQDMYVSPALVYTDDDPDRLVDDGISGGQITLGRFLGENFAIEGVFGSHGLDGVDNLDLTEFGLNARWVFSRNGNLSPYVLVGYGILRSDFDIFPDDDAGFSNIGAGLEWHLGDGPASLRGEYRRRHSSSGNQSYTDQITSIGFSFAFGADDKPMPAPVAAPDPDSDGDGVPDSRDACPDTPAGHQVDSRGCSLDSDGDGVADADDKCPNTYRGAKVDAMGCEMDDDKDGVVNRLDECPDTPAGVRVNTKGCEIKDVIKLPGVNFETNSDRLLPSADNVLADAAATLKKYPDLVVEVAGYTDSSGAADYNQGLSERRAATVRDYLINAGVIQTNLSSRGYGETQPVADNATAEGRADNRRVELRIIED